MMDFDLSNNALNEIFFTILKGADRSGTGKIDNYWKVISQTKFDYYIKYLN